MTDTGTRDAVDAYLAHVRAALSDLPEAEVGEILDDVGPHVAEVAQELLQDGPSPETGAAERPPDGSVPEGLAERLRERLGDPERYAAELRAAAGYPPRPTAAAVPARPSLLPPRLALALLVVATVLPLFSAGSTLAPVEVLLGTGVLFVALLVAALSLLITSRLPGGVGELAALPELRWLHRDRQPETVRQYARLLQHGWWLARAGVAALLVVAVLNVGLGPLIVVPVVAFAIVSAWLGLRSQADRRWLWLVLPLNAFAVALALSPLFGFGLPTNSRVVYVPTDSGTGFTNIYPYDSSGDPLHGVYLYDEDGRPLIPPAGPIVSGCLPPGTAPVPANQYPQPRYVFDRFGNCVPAPSAGQTTPVLSPTPPVSSAVASTPAGSATPTS
jgi:uncharacterized membrane protein